jgi:hypothetical protein
VYNPNFLNVLEVVPDGSSYFVITEPPLGQSIADLLKERSGFDVNDVLALAAPLAGALDLAASFACYTNSISARWLFAEKRHSSAVDSEQSWTSEWASYVVKMDVWELVRPRNNLKWPLSTPKGQSGRSRALAVRQAALLTYELLGGEKKKADEIKRWFKPVNGLGDTGNAILCRGLQGSPVFESSEGFFHKFKSAIQSDALKSRVFPGSAFSTQKNSVSLSRASVVIREFNRNTRCLAAGVLGAMVFGALVLAVLLPERHPNAVDPPEALQARSNLLLNANLSTISKEVGVSGKSSTGKTTPGEASRIEPTSIEVSQNDNSTSQMEARVSTSTPFLAFTPGLNQMDAKVAASFRSPPHRQDHARSMGPKINRARSSGFVRPKFSDVKMRLLALWHQSLRSERSRSWTPFSNLNQMERKKVGYTAQMSH